MTESKVLTYNFPGYGPLHVTLYPYASCIYDFLSYYGHEARLQSTNQLGVLRNIFKGAHHTRYEFVFIQWAFVNELRKIKSNSEVPLSANRSRYGRLDEFDNSPTGAEILQILILLINSGHLPETFTALRSFLHILRSDRTIRIKFRFGLDSKDRGLFDETLESFQVFHMQYLVTLFLLQRYTRLDKYSNGKDIVSLASNILRDYINRKKEDSKSFEPLKKIFSLHDKIRRLAYIALDSHYTPVPFSITLSSIFLNLEESIDSIANQNSSFNLALRQLNEVVRDNVYMCGPALIEISRVTEEKINMLKGLIDELRSITDIKQLLMPSKSALKVNDAIYSIFNPYPISSSPNQEWDPNNITHLMYEYEDLKNCCPDVVALERYKRRKIGFNSCRVGIQLCPEKLRLAIAYSLNSALTDNEKLCKSMSILSDISYFESRHLKVKNLIYGDNNYFQCFTMFLRSGIFKNTRFKLESQMRKEFSPFFVGKGSKKASQCFQKYINDSRIQGDMSKDELHELKICEELLLKLDFSGTIFCFVGSTKVIKSNSNNDYAEFDGLVILPNENPYERFALIIEAKNQKSGHTKGKKQLRTSLNKLLSEIIEYDIYEIRNKGAYAVLKLKK